MKEKLTYIHNPYMDAPEQDPPPMDLCPVCDKEYDTGYIDRYGTFCGCENCMKRVRL